jgi:hypothetical protein
MAKQESWLKAHAAELLIGAVAVPSLLYAVPTAYKTEHALAAQSEELRLVRAELRDIKQSFVAVLLDKDPDKAKIIERLVSDARAIQGAKLFEQGQYQAAYAIWVPAAKQGSKDSALALQVATAALKQKATDPSLPESERQKAAATMAGFGVEFDFKPAPK